MKCASGDLAVIISSRFRSNIGAFVKLTNKNGLAWEFTAASKQLMFGVDDVKMPFVLTKETTEDKPVYLNDSDLHPIRGYVSKEQIELLRKWL